MPDTDHGTVRDENGAKFSNFPEIEERTSDPTDVDPGEMWYREDNNTVRFFDGVSVWEIPVKSPPSSTYMDALTVVSDANGPGFLPMTSDVENAALPQFNVRWDGTTYAIDVVSEAGFDYTSGVNGLGGEKLQHTETWETNDLATYSLQHEEGWETN